MNPEPQIGRLSDCDSPPGWRPRAIALAPDAPIVGIDVGERTLDLAIADSDRMRLERVDLAGVENSADGAIAELARRIETAAPELKREGATAIIDSPRYPRDSARRNDAGTKGRYSRLLDARLASVVGQLRAARMKSDPSFGLWLFPTPPHEDFIGYANDPACPPHLVSLVHELFPQYTGTPDGELERFGAGRIFTRFMIGGFALYLALSRWPVNCFEGFPDLYFRLRANGREIRPKRAGRRHALESRLPIVAAAMHQSNLRGAAPATLDQADAAILAASIGAARGSGAVLAIEAPSEGVFALPVELGEALRLIDSSTPVDFGMINKR